MILFPLCGALYDWDKHNCTDSTGNDMDVEHARLISIRIGFTDGRRVQLGKSVNRLRELVCRHLTSFITAVDHRRGRISP